MNLYFRLLLTVIKALRAATARSGLIRNADIYPVLGFDRPSPPLPEDLQAWIGADRLLGARTNDPAIHARV
jgi:hypothetical protein